MFGPAKYAVAIVLLFVIAGMISPLIMFFIELVDNPNLIAVSYEIAPKNVTHAKLKVTISYKGTVGLRNFTIKAFNKAISFGNINKGNYTKTVFLPYTSLKRATNFSMAFSVAGLYKFYISVKGEKR